MLNGIGNQVSFRAQTTSEQIRQQGTPAKLSEAHRSYSDEQSAAVQSTDKAAPKSHKVLKTVGFVAVLAGLAYAAKTGRLGETAQKYFNSAAKSVQKFYETAKNALNKPTGEIQP
jgi:hypothetical protein